MDPAGGTLSVDYRPIAELAGRTIVGYEARLTWTHPTLGVIQPGRLLPAAYSKGLAPILNRRLLHAACAHAACHHDPGGRPLPVHVPVGATQLADEAVIGEIQNALGATKLPPDALVLEVRATAHSSDLMAAAPTVGRLRDLGVRISLAEVGAPDTTVDALRVLPMDMAVLDTAVTGPLGETRDDVRATVMLTSLLDAFRQLGVVVTAGGVNDERAAERATRLGCTLGIGRLFGDWQADPPRLARGRPPGRRPDPQTPTARGRT